MPYAQPGEAIFARLTTALASTAAAGRIYPTMPTENERRPYVVYQRVSGGGATNFHGRSGLQQYTYRVDVYADNETAGEAIVTAMNDPTNGLPGWSDRANGVQGVFPADDASTDVYEDASRNPGQSFTISFAG